MKGVLFSLLLLCVGFGFASDQFGKIYEEARALKEEHRFDDDLDKLLFDFYKRKVGAIDVDILKLHSELVFRKVLAQSEIILGLSFDEQLASFAEMQKDLQLILNYAQKETMLHRAARFRADIVHAVLQNKPQTEEDIFIALQAFTEEILKKWATNPNLTKRALRQNVVQNIWANPELKDSFFQFVCLGSTEIEIALGTSKPHYFEIMGVDEDDELVYRLECYLNGNRLLVEVCGL